MIIRNTYDENVRECLSCFGLFVICYTTTSHSMCKQSLFSFILRCLPPRQKKNENASRWKNVCPFRCTLVYTPRQFISNFFASTMKLDQRWEELFSPWASIVIKVKGLDLELNRRILEYLPNYEWEFEVNETMLIRVQK